SVPVPTKIGVLSTKAEQNARKAFHKFHSSRGDERTQAAADFGRAIGTDIRTSIELLHGEGKTRFAV
ncbi:MAG: hypothetical protein WBP52_05525, partial [Terriglobales bacterium]